MHGSHRDEGDESDHTPLLHSLYQHGPYPIGSITWKVLKSSYVNVLLVFVPLGILAGALHWPAIVVFVLNFLAIIPLSSLMGFATEELAIQVGETAGGLLNASFGNATELIVSLIALLKGEIRLVQASMLGSILSNILLVLGCCFIVGGIKYHEQEFNTTIAQAMSSLMFMATSSLILPAAFQASQPKSVHTDDEILSLSRGVSFVLLIIYILFLFFQLKTHASLYQNLDSDNETSHTDPEPALLSGWIAVLMLLVVTVVVALCAEFLVGSIDTIVQQSNISKTFIGLILLPIVGNAAEHATGVIVAYKNKMDLAIGVALGSSMQIALFLTPLLVLIGWAVGQPMTLYFQTFETTVLFISVIMVNYLIMDGKSNWLEGAMLVCVYVILAICYYIYPDRTSELVTTPLGQ